VLIPIWQCVFSVCCHCPVSSCCCNTFRCSSVWKKSSSKYCAASSCTDVACCGKAYANTDSHAGDNIHHNLCICFSHIAIPVHAHQVWNHFHQLYGITCCCSQVIDLLDQHFYCLCSSAGMAFSSKEHTSGRAVAFVAFSSINFWRGFLHDAILPHLPFLWCQWKKQDPIEALHCSLKCTFPGYLILISPF